MAPIRIAFIGLSASRGWATGAHLPYLQQTTKYIITGICNSSKESSEAAIKAYNLGPEVKAYGSPEELAADAEAFNLVVCSVFVHKHYETVKPVLATGKQCFVEWPLGKDLQEAEEMLELVEKSGNARTMVGLQGRRSPIINKIKQLISEGAIGRVLSSSVRSSAGNLGAIESEGIGSLFNDKKIGANMSTIHFGHMVDFVLYALGEEIKTFSAILSTQHKTPKLKHSDGRLEEGVRDTPDQILIQGHLQSGAVLSIHQRGGVPFKGEPGLSWRIYGEKGEIDVSSVGTFMQVGYGDDMHIKLHDYQKDEVQVIDWSIKDDCQSLPGPAQNIGRLYEAFADGNVDQYADWEQAVARHRLIQKAFESSETGKSVSL